MSDPPNLSKVIELIQIGFNVSLDVIEYEDSLDEIVELARMFNATVVLRNVSESFLNPKRLKKLKSHSHKIIIEV